MFWSNCNHVPAIWQMGMSSIAAVVLCYDDRAHYCPRVCTFITFIPGDEGSNHMQEAGMQMQQYRPSSESMCSLKLNHFQVSILHNYGKRNVYHTVYCHLTCRIQCRLARFGLKRQGARAYDIMLRLAVRKGSTYLALAGKPVNIIMKTYEIEVLLQQCIAFPALSSMLVQYFNWAKITFLPANVHVHTVFTWTSVAVVHHTHQMQRLEARIVQASLLTSRPSELVCLNCLENI